MLTWIQDSTLLAEIDASGDGFAVYSKGMLMYLKYGLNLVHFSSGVYDDSTCSQEMIDHVVRNNRHSLNGCRTN